MKQTNEKSEMYAVIGLGRFGFALAKRLAEAGKELIVVDKEESVIHKAVAFTDNAYIIRELTRENLRNIGIQNCDTVIVGIGGKIDISILTTLTVIQLGVKRVIAKALSMEQGCVLEKLGAEVVYPERDMGIRVANRLLAPRVLEYISLSEEICITEIVFPENTGGITVQELDIRRRYGLNIIAIKRGETVTTDITPDLRLQENDIIAVIGRQEQVSHFESNLRKRRR